MAGEILVPHSGIKLTSPALQGRFVAIRTIREVESHLFFSGWKTLHQLCPLPRGRAPSKVVSTEGTGPTRAVLQMRQRLPHLEVGFLNSRVRTGLPFTELWIHEGLTSKELCDLGQVTYLLGASVSHLQSGGAPLQGLVKFKSKYLGPHPVHSGPPVSGRFYCHFTQSGMGYKTKSLLTLGFSVTAELNPG